MILRLAYADRVGMLAQITATIARLRGDFRAVELVKSGGGQMIRDFTVLAKDQQHAEKIFRALNRLSGVTIIHVADRILNLHLGGKIHVQNKLPLNNRDALS